MTVIMPTKQRRYVLKAKEAKQILDEATKTLNKNLELVSNLKTTVEVVDSDVGMIYILSKIPVLFKEKDKMLPTLLFSEFIAKAPRIIVDMGAVPFVCKGATVMAPGIVSIEGTFKTGDIVVIADVKHGKALAIGESLMDSENAKKTKKGPIAKTNHYISDKIWDYIKNIS
jgi:PUA-domain protein